MASESGGKRDARIRGGSFRTSNSDQITPKRVPALGVWVMRLTNQKNGRRLMQGDYFSKVTFRDNMWIPALLVLPPSTRVYFIITLGTSLSQLDTPGPEQP